MPARVARSSVFLSGPAWATNAGTRVSRTKLYKYVLRPPYIEQATAGCEPCQAKQDNLHEVESQVAALQKPPGTCSDFVVAFRIHIRRCCIMVFRLDGNLRSERQKILVSEEVERHCVREGRVLESCSLQSWSSNMSRLAVTAFISFDRGLLKQVSLLTAA